MVKLFYRQLPYQIGLHIQNYLFKVAPAILITRALNDQHLSDLSL